MARKLEGNFYVVIKPKGWSGLAGRLTSSKPKKLGLGEVAIKLNISVPETLFTKPQLTASVIVPESAITPAILDIQVQDNIREVLEQQTGLSITLNVVEPQKEA